MLKYQKGYIFAGHTFVVNKGDVHNAQDDSFVDGTALLPAPEIVTNADRIRAMSDEELAKFLDKVSIRCPRPSITEDCSMPSGCEKCVLKWLQQQAEEG